MEPDPAPRTVTVLSALGLHPENSSASESSEKWWGREIRLRRTEDVWANSNVADPVAPGGNRGLWGPAHPACDHQRCPSTTPRASGTQSPQIRCTQGRKRLVGKPEVTGFKLVFAVSSKSTIIIFSDMN